MLSNGMHDSYKSIFEAYSESVRITREALNIIWDARSYKMKYPNSP
jgi:hypothetical protein